MLASFSCRFFPILGAFLLANLFSTAHALELQAKEYASGFEKPVSLGAMPGDKARLCVLEEAGRLVCLKSGFRPGKKPFLDFAAAKIALASAEETLRREAISHVFHPKFKDNGLLYVSSVYVNDKPGARLVVSEFKRSAEAESASAGSERELWSLQLPHREHLAGSLTMDSKGLLYIGVPDGGGKFDPKDTAQNTGSFFGSVLRIDPLQGETYLPPIDNPFVGDEKLGLPEMYAFGFHNPVGLSFDLEKDEVWAVDRGVNNFEEINILASGRNYGWSVFEGTLCQRMKFQCLDSNYKKPVFAYSHNDGSLILGGYVYRGANQEALSGSYLFADGASGTLWKLERSEGQKTSKTRLMTLPARSSVLGQDSDGELFVASYTDGKVFLVTPPK